MPYCYVPNCTSGSAAKNKYLEENNLPKPRFFSPCTEERRAIWDKIIKRKDKRMTLTCRVCSEHFTINDFDLDYITPCIDGSQHKLARGKAKLHPHANPSIFPQYPVYYQPKSSKRSAPKCRGSPRKKPKKIELPQVVPEIIITDEPQGNELPENLQQEKICNNDTVSTSPVWSCALIHTLKLPINWVVGNTLEADSKVLYHIDPKNEQMKSITFSDHQPKIVIKFRGIICKEFPQEVNSVDEAQKLLEQIDKVKVCKGTGHESNKFSKACNGMVTSKKVKRCQDCLKLNERLRKIEERKLKLDQRKKEKQQKLKNKVQSLTRSKLNLIEKVRKYKRRIEHVIRQCQAKDETVIAEAISKLPPAQQEAVKACFAASKRKGPSGRRYTAEWVYECMLMRIKDKKLYNHIRNHEILILPATSTINGYLKHYGGAYGFQPQVLDMLKKKTSSMKARFRRGMILIDEMKLTKGVYFDASTLQVLGFKDMGEEAEEALGEDFRETVEEAIQNLPVDPKAKQKIMRREKTQQKTKNDKDRNLGDHALVISFQPFRGKWVQAIACFLTRGNASDTELTKLVLEAVILLERSGLLVDGVVTDGAAWNRSMWTKFGVTKEKCSAEHPCDPQRKLFFISDFPHLMKCMRNCLCKKKIIQTPKGDVQLRHWEAVLEAEKLHKLGLRECHKLTQEHLNPDPWQKMNVAMAWQFWSGSVAAAMESYRFQEVDKLADCDASIEMCTLINNLADAMNSNRPENALRLGSAHFKAIEKFLHYFTNLKEWADNKLRIKLEEAEKSRIAQLRAQGKKPKGKAIKYQEDYIFSDSTDIGLIVTLKGTLELVNFLVKKCGYAYVMTARLNQDALERFFGLVRQSCGRNTHPEPRVFAQLFRLLSIYSLVKPCRGSNITGGEMVTTLFSLEDMKAKTRQERHKLLSDKLDEIIIRGQDLDHITDLMEAVEKDHDYLGDGESVDEFALSYVTGFVARHSKRYTEGCEECAKCLKKEKQFSTDVDMLITLKSRGYLTYPSDALVDLTRTMERNILKTAVNSEMEENILFLVLDGLDSCQVKTIGCETHHQQLTKAIMKFYLIMRMHFLTRKWNEHNKAGKKTRKRLSKELHLT